MNQAARKLHQDGRAERYRREELELRQSRQRERAARHHARLTRRACVCFVLSIVGLFGLLFIVARLNISSAQKALRAREIQEAAEGERKVQETLRVEVARLESSARVERVASEELGMVRAAGPLVVRLRSGEAGVVTAPTSMRAGAYPGERLPGTGEGSIQ